MRFKTFLAGTLVLAVSLLGFTSCSKPIPPPVVEDDHAGHDHSKDGHDHKDEKPSEAKK